MLIEKKTEQQLSQRRILHSLPLEKLQFLADLCTLIPRSINLTGIELKGAKRQSELAEIDTLK